MKNYLPLFLFLLFLSACTEDEQEAYDAQSPLADEPSTLPAISDADAVLLAIRTSSWSGIPPLLVNTPVGTAAAEFYDTSASAVRVNVGQVQCENKTLDLQSNKSYRYVPPGTDPLGIDFGGDPWWSSAGNSVYLHDASSYTTGVGFPSIDSVANVSPVFRSAAFTLNASGISSSDSVFFIIASVGKVLRKTVPGGNASATFTASEMNSLGDGDGYLIIAPWNVELYMNGGRSYYYVNQALAKKRVSFK